MTAMLNVKDLRAYYGQVQALHGLEFGLNEGSLTTLLGANGAGKTTTLRAICNMVRSTGAIEFEGASLSGGEQQMLAVARALMLRPRLMLLDEPSFGLAPLIVRDLFGILGKINREDKVTILVVEQNAQLALELAEKAFVIETGRIVMSGSAKEIANNEDIRKSYLGY